MVMINISLMYKGLLKGIFCDLKGLPNVLNFKLLVQFFVDNNKILFRITSIYLHKVILQNA